MKESLYFFQKARIELPYTFDVSMELGVCCNGNETVVPNLARAFLALLRHDGADDAHADDACHRRRVVQQKQDVERIPVFCPWSRV